MRTEKIKDNPTRIEELEWLLKCAKHYEAGGKVKFDETNLHVKGRVYGDPLWMKDAKDYEIVLEPEYRPYNTVEEVPVGKVVIRKDNKVKTVIGGAASDSNYKLDIQTSYYGLITPEGILDEYTFEDGSPAGVEVEG